MSMPLWVKLLIGGAVLIVVLSNYEACKEEIGRHGMPRRTREVCDDVDLILAAEREVTRRLLAPTTAVFGEYASGIIDRGIGTTITYTNYVDSENKLGVPLRAYFVVTMTCEHGAVQVLHTEMDQP